MSSALRMARYRQRQRVGLRVVTLEIDDDDITALDEAGFYKLLPDDDDRDERAVALRAMLDRLKS